MVELSERQMKVVERLLEAGFRPMAMALYEKAFCFYKGECAAVVAPVESGGLRLLAQASYLVDGNLSVRLKKGSGEVFVWKKTEVAATPARLQALEQFRGELAGLLEEVPT